LKPYIGHARDDQFDVVVLIYGAKERVAIQKFQNPTSFSDRFFLNNYFTSFCKSRAPLPLDTGPFLCSSNQHHKNPTHNLPPRLSKTPINYTFTLKIATVMSAETLCDYQHPTWLNTKSQSNT
jgi:hypothetical protein